MTVIILCENGRVLTDKSLSDITNEFLRREKKSKVRVYMGPSINDTVSLKQMLEGKNLSEWDLIFIPSGEPAYKLGDEQKERLVSDLALATGTTSSYIIKNILFDDEVFNSQEEK